MGLLVDGQWQDKWYETKESGGRFQRALKPSLTAIIYTCR